MKNSILFLGGNGFLARSLIPYLSKDHFSIRVFDRNDRIYSSDIQHIQGDFFHFADSDIFKGVDTVVYAISSLMPSHSLSNINNEIRDDLMSFINLLEHCVRYKVSKLIFFSSAGTVYGERLEKAKETDACNPISIYGVHKCTMEQYMMLYARTFGVNCISLRISNPYGEQQFQGAKNGVIATFLKNIQNGKPCTVWGQDTICKDYIYIKDLCQAILKVICSDVPSGFYNLGYGKSHSIAQIIATMENILHRKLVVNIVDSCKYDVKSILVDIEKIKNTIQWFPKTDLQQGITHMCKFLGLK